MKLYRLLSSIQFLKNSYVFKFLFVAFLGIHIPLIGVILFLISDTLIVTKSSILITVLILTLAATGITLLVLKGLVNPIKLASSTLLNYRKGFPSKRLPLSYSDEAGLLMKNIQETIDENETLIQDKLDLVYLLSHDLRNFAAAPQSLAQLILHDSQDPQMQEYAQLILESTGEQIKFLDTFIKLVKEEDALIQLKSNPETVYFVALKEYIRIQSEQKMLQKEITLQFEGFENTAQITIPEDLLLRVVMNLIDNAYKFSYKGTNIIINQCITNNELILSVTDFGLGFMNEKVPAFFKKFSREGRKGTLNEPSTGIGLYTCKRIVEKFGGSITANSDGMNKGATFIVSIPILQ